jgi:hypothetical protein
VGDVQRYLATFAVGAAAVVWLASRPPLDLEVKKEGLAVEINANPGADASKDLSYEFDFDGGGADRTGDAPTARYVYEGAGTYTVRVTVRDKKWRTSRTVEQKVSVR